ncbi:uncharacterized protein [Blastocystis hominis]|uniref:Uncharacterized protein n=1 Tax=Blastocystis hominis TaxID=12968 RepID=D8MA80_BLAHO|nr:uncharacterized protein [Blastocystis hominis]CBK24969.2 unnamed protein product [Blastocystis hominis]|eukprot:XP_012899017.1 uncharacterized protein [Blastocystis hominis]
MLVGDAVAQKMSPQAKPFDFKRFACVGISSFCISGPLSFTVNRIVHKLYPGSGHYSLLKRICVTSSLSPLMIAAGIIPSVYLQTGDSETVRHRVINRVPLNWFVSLIFLTPFTYFHSRYVTQRLQKVTRTTYNMFYSSFMATRNNPKSEEIVIDLLL